MHDPSLQGRYCRLGAITDPEALQNYIHMAFDRSLCNAEQSGYFLVTFSVYDQR